MRGLEKEEKKKKSAGKRCKGMEGMTTLDMKDGRGEERRVRLSLIFFFSCRELLASLFCYMRYVNAFLVSETGDLLPIGKMRQDVKLFPRGSQKRPGYKWPLRDATTAMIFIV